MLKYLKPQDFILPVIAIFLAFFLVISEAHAQLVLDVRPDDPGLMTFVNGPVP